MELNIFVPYNGCTIVTHRTRFMKSYKYKHKIKMKLNNRTGSSVYQISSASRWFHMISMILLSSILILSNVNAFCPSKCACNDLELTANCTQPSAAISSVPMTLNPLLKRLQLNNLPISELGNSLALYRQLEYLNLNSLQLRQIKYENFNFKSAPKSLTLNEHLHQLNEESSIGREQLAHHLKQTLERPHDEAIKFHLRELYLADNKLELLAGNGGSLNGHPPQPFNQTSKQQHSLQRHELEQLAPFLTLAKLQILDLSGNRLSRLHQHQFLGLIQLQRLNLARNQLEFVDQHALVGLLELTHLDLSHNKLLNQHFELIHLARTFCFGPLLEMRHLDLGSNVHMPPQAPPVHLPNRMFNCAPKIQWLKLNSLQLNYIQAQAFEPLRHMQVLDLSDNPLEQVPLLNVIFEQEQQFSAGSSLLKLNLSKTMIEFVNANSFRHLTKLEHLQMNQMRQLISFDLASLITSGLASNNQLRELEMNQNHRLQSFYSSATQAIKFWQLEKLDLSGSSELRELQLDKMIDLRATNSRQPIELDLSNSNNLNCSSCHMNWLIEAFKSSDNQRQQSPTVRRPLERDSSNNNNNGWSPIPFDPYNSFALQQIKPSHELPLALLNFDLINCAWPFSMPLIELINLETNYAPLFGHACSKQEASGESEHKVHLGPNLASRLLQFAPPSASLNTEGAHSTATYKPMPGSGLTLASANQTLGEDHQAVNPTTLAAYLLLGLTLTSLLAALVVKLRQVWSERFKLTNIQHSPSFTATTSIDSPSSACDTANSDTSHQRTARLVTNPLPIYLASSGAQMMTQQPELHSQLAQHNHYYYHSLAAPLPLPPPPPTPLQQQQQIGAARGNAKSLGVRLSSALTNVEQQLDNAGSFVVKATPASERGNLFSRFVNRLSGTTSGRCSLTSSMRDETTAPMRSALPHDGVGTSLRYHGARLPLRNPNFTQGRVQRVEPMQQQPIYCNYSLQRDSDNLPSTMTASAPVQVDASRTTATTTTTTNHYSICGHNEQHYTMFDETINEQMTPIRESRRNKRRRRQRDHLNNQLPAADYEEGQAIQ